MENRTPIYCLEGSRFTTKLCPLVKEMITNIREEENRLFVPLLKKTYRSLRTSIAALFQYTGIVWMRADLPTTWLYGFHIAKLDFFRKQKPALTAQVFVLWLCYDSIPLSSFISPHSHSSLPHTSHTSFSSSIDRIIC